MRKLANAELNRISKEAFAEAKKTPLIIILDDIRSLHNIGSVFRTSDAFLIEKIYLCGITAVPPNKEIHKTALGATDTVTWEYAKDVLKVISIFIYCPLEILFYSEFDSITFSVMYQFVFFETIRCPYMTILLSSQTGLNHFYRF